MLSTWETWETESWGLLEKEWKKNQFDFKTNLFKGDRIGVISGKNCLSSKQFFDFSTYFQPFTYKLNFQKPLAKAFRKFYSCMVELDGFVVQLCKKVSQIYKFILAICESMQVHSWRLMNFLWGIKRLPGYIFFICFWII